MAEKLLNDSLNLCRGSFIQFPDCHIHDNIGHCGTALALLGRILEKQKITKLGKIPTRGFKIPPNPQENIEYRSEDHNALVYYEGTTPYILDPTLSDHAINTINTKHGSWLSTFDLYITKSYSPNFSRVFSVRKGSNYLLYFVSEAQPFDLLKSSNDLTQELKRFWTSPPKNVELKFWFEQKQLELNVVKKYVLIESFKDNVSLSPEIQTKHTISSPFKNAP